MAAKGISVYTHQGEDYTINDPNIANEFSASANYTAGTYVNYQGNLYRFTADHSAGTWSGSDVMQIHMGDEVSNLKKEIKKENFDPIYDNTVDGIYINGNTWAAATGQNTANCGIFRVEPGSSVYMEGNGSNSTTIAALKTFGSPAVGDTVDFSEATGWTGTKTIAKDAKFSAVLPDDCAYLYVYYGLNNANNRLPGVFYINGDSVYSLVKDYLDGRIDRNESVITSTGVIDAEQYVVDSPMYIDTSTGQWKQITNASQKRGFLLYPISADDQIAIYGKSGVTVIAAVLSDYIEPLANAHAIFSSATGFTSTISVAETSLYKFTAPSDAKYLYIFRGLTTSALRMPSCLLINGYDVIKTAKKSIYDNAPTNIRVMQYNIGKYNWGTAGGLSEADYQEKLPNYKQFFCKYHPEIISIEEFVEYMDTAETHKANDVLFDELYPNEVWNTDYQRNIKTKFEIIHSVTGSLSTTVEESTKYARYSFARIRYGNKIIALFCTALPHQHDPDVMTARSNLIELALEMMEDDDYAFVALDVNNNGNGSTVDSETEGTSINNMLITKGWKGTNGGYLPFAVTHPSDSAKIDSIFYKNNGKIIFNNFEVLSSEYENLSSDHYPVIGDFTLL